MSQDTLSPFEKGGINGYVFAHNNPVMAFDPSGHSPISLLFLSIVGMVINGEEYLETAGVDIGAGLGLVSDVANIASSVGLPGAAAMSDTTGIVAATLGGLPEAPLTMNKIDLTGKESLAELKHIGSGRYHDVFKIESGQLIDGLAFNGPWAYKIAKQDEVFTDLELETIHPKRSVRIMKEVNPEMPVAEYGQGWIMPFNDSQSSLEQVAAARQDIFNRSGRLVIDDTVDNIVNNQLYDPDWALRPGSPVSDRMYPGLSDTFFYKDFSKSERNADPLEEDDFEAWLNA